MLISILIGVALFLIAVWFQFKNNGAIRFVNVTQLTKEESDFFVAQIRRRKQVNGTLALVGIAITCSPFLPEDNWVQMGFWLVVAVLIASCGLLAVADMANIHLFYRILEDQQLVAEAEWAKRASEEYKSSENEDESVKDSRDES